MFAENRKLKEQTANLKKKKCLALSKKALPNKNDNWDLDGTQQVQVLRTLLYRLDKMAADNLRSAFK